MVALQLGQHVAPARHRLADPEAQEGECDLGQDVARHQQRSLGEDHPTGLRQDVAQQQIAIGGTEAARRPHEIALPAAQGDAADQARRPRPA